MAGSDDHVGGGAGQNQSGIYDSIGMPGHEERSALAGKVLSAHDLDPPEEGSGHNAYQAQGWGVWGVWRVVEGEAPSAYSTYRQTRHMPNLFTMTWSA